MKLPSIKEVADQLSRINANVEGSDGDNDEGCDVRLQVYPDGRWAVRYGLSDYDQDHRGYFGASSVPGVVNGKVLDFEPREVARDLIEQVRDQYDEAEEYD